MKHTLSIDKTGQLLPLMAYDVDANQLTKRNVLSNKISEGKKIKIKTQLTIASYDDHVTMLKVVNSSYDDHVNG